MSHPTLDAVMLTASLCGRYWANVITVHDPDYRAALQDFNTFIEKVSEKVIEADELIPELPVKDVVSLPALP
jgi:hypothetical protein